VTETPLPASSQAVEPPPPGEAWTILHLLRWSARYLEEKGIEGGRLDGEHLLADTLGMGRLDLYLHFDRPLTAEELEAFKPRLLERARRKPLQYILGRTSFRELELRTDPRVLIPRPETEELVEAVLQRVREGGAADLSALDVGTGSGAIALSLAREGPFRRVVATDRSPEALEVARENARTAGLDGRVEFREGRLFETVEAAERFHVVVSNPPYVTEEEFRGLQPEVRDWEPREALVAEEGGTAVLDALVEGAGRVLETGGLIALEVGVDQAGKVADRIRAAPGYAAPMVLRDLAGRDRILLARWTGDE
jgi:release factor glutamine methyltransferase